MLFAITRARKSQNAPWKEDATSQNDESGEVNDLMPQTESECAKVLGIEGPVTPEHARQRWRLLSKQYHPDQVQNLGIKLRTLAEAEMKRLNAAYDFFRRK